MHLDTATISGQSVVRRALATLTGALRYHAHMTRLTNWQIDGADGETILGNTHLPDGSPRGIIVIAHGFKGYKDYGMFPYVARRFSERGYIAHRFNFSHSGMTNETDTFARPDLFERDTWGKQVDDLHAVIRAMRDDLIDGGLGSRDNPQAGDLPFVLFGHSRGGVSVLLATLDLHGDEAMPRPAGVITAATPARCNTLREDEQNALLEHGALDAPSSRTGQTLRVGRAFLDEQRADPERFDLFARLADRDEGLPCPALIVHGEQDPTVPVKCAEQLTKAIGPRATLVRIADADHVFNTPNPMPGAMDGAAEPSAALGTLFEHATTFADDVCSVM